jgi:hypothetical protein
LSTWSCTSVTAFRNFGTVLSSLLHILVSSSWVGSSPQIVDTLYTIAPQWKLLFQVVMFDVGKEYSSFGRFWPKWLIIWNLPPVSM